MFKFLIAFVVLVAAAGALWWAGLITKFVPSVPTPQSLMAPKPAPKTVEPQATTTPPTPEPPAPTFDLPTSVNDASDDALTKDAAAIDAQITALSGDNTDAQAALLDKAVTQEY